METKFYTNTDLILLDTIYRQLCSAASLFLRYIWTSLSEEIDHLDMHGD